MPLTLSGWVVWNAGSLAHPHFVPKEIYPPALQIAEISETVYATRLEAQSAINNNGGPGNYRAASGAEKTGPEKIPPDIAGSAQGGLTGVDAIGSFFANLGKPGSFVRLGEFAVGGMLIYVAAKAMFPGAVNTVTAPVRKTIKSRLPI